MSDKQDTQSSQTSNKLQLTREQPDSTPDESKEIKPESSEKTKKGFREKLQQFPKDLDTAIDEGKANLVIEGVQELIGSFISSTFDSCRLASLRLFMLTKDQRSSLSKSIYILAIIAAGLCCIDLLIYFNVETIILSVMFIVGAYLADLIINSAVLKQKHATPHKTAKSKTKKVAPPPSSTDDDIL